MHHFHPAPNSHTESHSGDTSVATTGHLIRWATRYDWLVQMTTLGRAAQLRKRMADLVPLQPGNTVLDIGCGTGDLAFQLARRVGTTGNVIGVDPSPEMIARARLKAQHRRLAIDFREESAAALSLDDQSVDYAVSSLVFHHLPGALQRQALASVARVLKPGGQLIIIDFIGNEEGVSSHAIQQPNTQDLLSLLNAAGLRPARNGRLSFFGLNRLLPSMGYVVAQQPVA